MEVYFGKNEITWPSPTADSDRDGVNNLQEFLAGTDPTNPNSVLRQQLIQTEQGLFLNWNTQLGHTYQVQVTTNFTSWSVAPNASARFAAGTNDSIYVGGAPAGYYRVQFLY
jgi:hypothetical protein